MGQLLRRRTFGRFRQHLVAEDGREVYAGSSESDWSRPSPWTLEHVRPQLDGKSMSLEDISDALRDFADNDEDPVFWRCFPACDWAALVGLCGGLEELPFHCPQLCLDIGVTRSRTHAGPAKPGRFWPGSVPLAATGAASSPRIRAVRRRRTT